MKSSALSTGAGGRRQTCAKQKIVKNSCKIRLTAMVGSTERERKRSVGEHTHRSRGRG